MKTLCLFVALISFILLSGCDSEQVSSVGQSIKTKATLAPANTIIFNSSNRRLAHVGANTTQIQIKVPSISAAPTFVSFEMKYNGATTKDVFKANPVYIESSSNSCAFNVYTLTLKKPLKENSQYIINGQVSETDKIMIPYYFNTQSQYKIFDSSPSGNSAYMGNGATGVNGFDSICKAAAESYGYYADSKAMIGSWLGASGTGIPRSICINESSAGFESAGQCGGDYSKNWIFQRNSNYYNIKNNPIESSDSYGILPLTNINFSNPISVSGQSSAWSAFTLYWTVLTGESDNYPQLGDLSCNGWTSSSTSARGSMGYHNSVTSKALISSTYNPFQINGASCDSVMQVACVEQPQTALVEPANPNNASVNTLIEVQFGYSVESSTVNLKTFSVYDENGVPVDGTISEMPNSDGTTTAPNNTNFVFAPSSALNPGSTYTVVINESGNESSSVLLDGVGNIVPQSSFTITTTNNNLNPNIRDIPVMQLVTPSLPVGVPTHEPIFISLPAWVNYSNAQATIEEINLESSTNKRIQMAPVGLTLALAYAYATVNIFMAMPVDANESAVALSNYSRETLTITGLTDFNGLPLPAQTGSFTTEPEQYIKAISAESNSITFSVLTSDIKSIDNVRMRYCSNSSSNVKDHEIFDDINEESSLTQPAPTPICNSGQTMEMVSLRGATLVETTGSLSPGGTIALAPAPSAPPIADGSQVNVAVRITTTGGGRMTLPQQVIMAASSAPSPAPLFTFVGPSTRSIASVNPAMIVIFSEQAVAIRAMELINSGAGVPVGFLSNGSSSSASIIPVFLETAIGIDTATGHPRFLLRATGPVPSNSGTLSFEFASLLSDLSSDPSAFSTPVTVNVDSAVAMRVLNMAESLSIRDPIMLGGNGITWPEGVSTHGLSVEWFNEANNTWEWFEVEVRPRRNVYIVEPPRIRYWNTGLYRINGYLYTNYGRLQINNLYFNITSDPFTLVNEVTTLPLQPRMYLETFIDGHYCAGWGIVNSSTVNSNNLQLIDDNTGQPIPNSLNVTWASDRIQVDVLSQLELNHHYHLENLGIRSQYNPTTPMNLSAAFKTWSKSVTAERCRNKACLNIFTALPFDTSSSITTNSISVRNSNRLIVTPTITSIRVLSDSYHNDGWIMVDFSSELPAGNYIIETTANNGLRYQNGESVTFSITKTL